MKQRGFELIDLMIAIAIFGILMAIAILQFQAFKHHAEQSQLDQSGGH